MSTTGRRLAAVLTAGLVAGCGSNTTPATTATMQTTAVTTAAVTTTTIVPDPVGPMRGLSLSPRTYDNDGFLEFFATAAPHVDMIESVTDILEWEGGGGTGTAVVHALAAEYGFEPLSITGVFDVADGTLLRPIDDATFARYVAAARGHAERYRPRFLGLGVEIDTQWRTHPDEFEGFVDLFAAIAAAVHEVSPDTQLLTVFQLERLSGMQGGVFGGVNDPTAAAWELIDRFPDADIIGFTTYPGLVFTDPAAIPDDYYRRLAGHTGGRPIAFTEMGWQAGGDIAEWSGSEQKQAAFLARFPELIDGSDVAFWVWSFLYDPPTVVPFSTMGLIAGDGVPRPAWQVWTASGP